MGSWASLLGPRCRIRGTETTKANCSKAFGGSKHRVEKNSFEKDILLINLDDNFSNTRTPNLDCAPTMHNSFDRSSRYVIK